ncbi:MAG: UDP-glucose 6-dehydrogenase, partial [Pseudogulbenkiania sp.]|nr:UDP-glucose 6-dehydrogenase [Pseudogulbenkiania sp.]
VMGDNPRLSFAEDMMSPLAGADALLIVTEWKMFRAPDFTAIHGALKTPVIIDGRNMYDPAWLRAQGFDYQAIGR